MDNLERYKRRKQILNSSNQSDKVEVNEKFVNEFLNSKADITTFEKITQEVENRYEINYDLDVSQDEIKEFLESFKRDFNQARFDKLIVDCKRDVINSIVTPFGLGHIVAAYDKTGGNVDTIHNVRNNNKLGLGMSEEESQKDGLGIYVTQEEKVAFENRPTYDKKEYKEYHDGNANYEAKKNRFQEQQQNGTLINGYNGEVIGNYEESDPTKQFGTEHIISAKEISDDPAITLANKQGSELANDESNLIATTKSVNSSKGEDSIEVFIQRVEKNKDKIKILESKQELTSKEQKKLDRLKRVTQADKEKMEKLDQQARDVYNKKLNDYYTSGKFAKNTAKTSATDGAKMGMQQALGLVMSELFTAIFDEILDIYRNGFSSGFDDERFFNVLQERLKTIGQKIKDKWKDVAIAFKDGFISGFISNLVTTAINMFATTGKRVVRIIREGIYSLFKAIKLLLFPPKNMSFEDAMHEAKKIIATGLLVTLGVIVEQYIDGLIKASIVLEPFSDILTTIFVGAITGLAITMTVYYIDKSKNDKDAMKILSEKTDKSFENCELLLKELAY